MEAKTEPAENLRVLEKFFKPFISLPFDDPSSLIYGRIRSDLARSSTMIGPNDSLLASIAIRNNLTLISANIKAFRRVVGLSLENWEGAQYEPVRKLRDGDTCRTRAKDDPLGSCETKSAGSKYSR